MRLESLPLRLTAVLLLILTGWGIAGFPVTRFWLALGIGGYAIILWRRRALWILAIPALLPVLDLTPWSGRLLFGPFDFVVWTTWAVLLLQADSETSRRRLPAPAALVVGALAISFFISALIGLLSLQLLDASTLTGYYSRYNSLRVFKGFLYALAFLPFLRREIESRDRFQKLFVRGVLLGLIGVGLVALWERQVFVGLFDLSTDFRITSTFYGMHVGGAYLEAYLAMALPVAAGGFFLLRGAGWRIVAALALGIGLYAGVATFSRIFFVSLGVSAAVLVIALLWIHGKRSRVFLAAGMLTLVVVFMAAAILGSSYLQRRMSESGRDAGVRLSHWATALEMMDKSWTDRLFGMGTGSFPRIYFQRAPYGRAPASHAWLVDDGNTFLRLNAGDPIYPGQRISLQPYRDYTIEVQLRSTNEHAALSIPICEKSLHRSFDCVWLQEKVGDTEGEWVTFSRKFSSGSLGADSARLFGTPVELAFYNGRDGTHVDIDNLRLLNDAGENLVRNGDFSAGGDFWFFTVDNHLPWHIFNLWVHLIFENGWVGFFVFNLFVAVVIFSLCRGVFQKDAFRAVLLSSVVGFLTVGMIGSLLDSPRISMLFFLIAFIGLLGSVEESDRGGLTRRHEERRTPTGFTG